MTRITLSDELVQLLSSATQSAELVDRHGQRIGFFSRLSIDDEVELAKRSLAAGGKKYTTQEVLDYLESLETK